MCDSGSGQLSCCFQETDFQTKTIPDPNPFISKEISEKNLWDLGSLDRDLSAKLNRLNGRIDRADTEVEKNYWSLEKSKIMAQISQVNYEIDRRSKGDFVHAYDEDSFEDLFKGDVKEMTSSGLDSLINGINYESNRIQGKYASAKNEDENFSLYVAQSRLGTRLSMAGREKDRRFEEMKNSLTYQPYVKPPTAWDKDPVVIAVRKFLSFFEQ